MRLPDPPTQYDAENEAQTRRTLEREDMRNQKIATPVVLTSANGTKFKLVVANDGTLSTASA